MNAYYQDDWTSIYNGDLTKVLPLLDIRPQLILTSPPYDKLRDYGGHGFDFDGVADAIVGAMPEGGVLVWVVNDSTKNNCKTGTSFRQALGFMDRGLNLYDTMIYEKSGVVYPHQRRYYQSFEYMFVFTRGVPQTVNLLKDRRNKWDAPWGRQTERKRDGSLVERGRYEAKPYGVRTNIWRYHSGGLMLKGIDKLNKEHPAPFPSALARDHIRTWTEPGDMVLDPMAGSGTTLRAAKDWNRKSVGIEIHAPYCAIIRKRVAQHTLKLEETA